MEPMADRGRQRFLFYRAASWEPQLSHDALVQSGVIVV